jgi:DNA-binding response OmpR family regulator
VENTTETMRLLVVSREIAALRPLWSIVESNSWHLETAATGWDAMERVQSRVAPHLLILDLARGDGDSLHVVRWMRRLRPELPILLLCHPGDADKKKDAIRLGADDVLVRPFPDEQLEFVIYRYLRGSKEAPQVEVVSENIEPMGDDGFFVSAGDAETSRPSGTIGASRRSSSDSWRARKWKRNGGPADPPAIGSLRF